MADVAAPMKRGCGVALEEESTVAWLKPNGEGRRTLQGS
jgi:hypothetical protein